MGRCFLNRHRREIDDGRRWHDSANTWSVDSLFNKSWEIFRQKRPLFIPTSPKLRSKRTVLQPGRYEWPFELEIAGSMKESVQALCNSHISYNLRAAVKRGRLSTVLRVQRPVRIIRAFHLAALSPTGELRDDGVWRDKIKYRVSIPQRAMVFGTALAIHIHLATLLKSLKIAEVRCALIESQQFRMPGTHPGTRFTRYRTVECWKFEPDYPDEYTLEEVLHLPKRFSMCVQDTDIFEIKVRHELHICVDLQNPDRHISEVRYMIIAAVQSRSNSFSFACDFLSLYILLLTWPSTAMAIATPSKTRSRTMLRCLCVTIISWTCLGQTMLILPAMRRIVSRTAPIAVKGRALLTFLYKQQV